MNTIIVAIVCLLIVSVYILFLTVLTKAAQPARFRLAELSKQLMESKDVPMDVKMQVKFRNDTLFGMKLILVYSILLMPFITAVYVVRARLFNKYIVDIRSMSHENRKIYREIDDLHDRITLANHPLLTMFVLIELMIFFVPGLLLRAFAKGKLPTEATARSVVRAVETRLANFRFSFNHTP
jgi:hypothetical protein